MSKNVADTGSPFFRSAVVEGDAGKIVEGTQLQKGDAYQVGIFGGTKLGNLRAPAIVDTTQTGQTTKKKIDPFNIGSMS